MENLTKQASPPRPDLPWNPDRGGSSCVRPNLPGKSGIMPRKILLSYPK